MACWLLALQQFVTERQVSQAKPEGGLEKEDGVLMQHCSHPSLRRTMTGGRPCTRPRGRPRAERLEKGGKGGRGKLVSVFFVVVVGRHTTEWSSSSCTSGRCSMPPLAGPARRCRKIAGERVVMSARLAGLPLSMHSVSLASTALASDHT